MASSDSAFALSRNPQVLTTTRSEPAWVLVSSYPSARNRVILYGANLPMLVKLAKLRHLPADQAAAMAAEAGRKYIDSYNVFDEVVPRKVAQ